MEHAEIINISTNMEGEIEFPMFPPSELKWIRHQLSISYGKQVQLINHLFNFTLIRLFLNL